jgi:hypothetical protein
MAVPMEPELREKYCYVLSLWDVTDYITWEDTALRWIYREFTGYTAELVGKLMYEHVYNGGDIYQIEETRSNWLEWRFHYDLYVPICGRETYIETRFLEEQCRDDCTINVVNVHDP